MKKKILKKIINEGCGREQKFEFCFDSSVRIFCSICLKTAQVNLGPCRILIRFRELVLFLKGKSYRYPFFRKTRVIPRLVILFTKVVICSQVTKFVEIEKL